jgi:gas vesicle protein
MADEGNGSSGVVWFFAGAAIGAAIALLYAPASGEETRRKIADGRSALGESGKEVFERGRELYERGRQLADEAADMFERGRKLVEGAASNMQKRPEHAEE